METTNTTNYPELDAAQLLSKMRVLSEINLELSNIKDLDELYKQVIIQAHERLGFDRLGLYLLDLEAEQLTGTYGISKNGQLQSDKEDRFYFSEGEWVKNFVFNEKRFTLEEDVDLWEDQEVIGHGWKASAALWIRDTPVGVFFADNLISQEPFQPHLPELLLAYSTDVATLINRLHTEKALQKSQLTLQDTLERQQILHDISLELSNIQDLDELYQQIIVKARERLGFDRIGLFLVNLDEEVLSGTYGISPDGELISIKHDIFNFSDGDWVKKLVYSQERIFVREDTDLLEGQEVIGRGWHLTASMKIRGTLIGIIFADNMVSRQPFQPHLPELLSAYSTDAANLIDRLRAYKALHQSEQTLQEVLGQQKALLTISQNLTGINDPDELYKQVILQAQEHLGFDRLGLYLLDIDNGTMSGTYGIDPQGKLRSEQDNTFSFKHEPWINGFIYNTERITVKEEEDLYERDEVIGRGWHMVAAIWQEDKPMGVLFADNLLSQAPLLPSQPDTLTAYASTIAQLIDRIQAEKALLESEQTVQTFVNKQKELHEIGLKLSSLENPDELYREAIQLGHDILGYDRLGLYLLNSEREVVHGTYGIGVDGKLRNEYDEVHVLANEPWMQTFLYDKKRLIVNEDAELHEDGKVVGHGWNLTATLWSLGKPIGLLFADNLIDQQPLQPHQPELLTAFSATIANLIERQQAATERERLLGDTEQQAKNLALLNEMSTVLNQTESAEDVYKIAGEYTQKITNDERTSLALLTENNQMMELFGLSGIKGAVPLGSKIPVQGSGIGLAIQEKQQACFPEDADMQTYIDTQKMAAEGLQSAISTPLFIEGTVIGCLNVASKSMPKNVVQKKRLLRQIGSLVSSALQVRQVQARTETILESITVPMLISRVSDGMIFYANDHLANMLETSLNELVGKQTPDFYVRNSDRDSIINKIRTEGGCQNYELELKKANQEQFWGLLTAKLIQFESETAVITSLIDVSDRKESQAATEQQAADLQTVADLSTQITSIQDPQKLMEVIVQETQRRFDLYHCHIFLVDESGKNLRIQACGWHPDAAEYGTHGDSVIALNAKQSLVSQAARMKQVVVINDVTKDPNWLPNKLLPDTRAELAIPMIVGDTVIGVFDVQSTTVNRFGPQDMRLQSTLAAQIAVALENANSLVKNQQAVDELDALTRRLTRESWEEYLADIEEKDTGFVYNSGQLSTVDETNANVLEGETAVSPTNGHLSQSLMVHGESIGHLTIFNEAETEQLNDDTALIIAAVAEQLSARVENIRLTNQTQQALAQTQDQAQRLGLLNEISAEMSNVDTLNQVFDIIFARIPNLLNVDRVSLAILQPDGETLEIIGHAGEMMGGPTENKFTLAGTPMAQALHDNRIIVSNQTSPDNMITSSMIAPIFSAGQAIGTLNIGSKRANGLTSKEEALLQQLATMLSSVIENKQLLAAAQARAERERQVRTITDKIRRGTDREAILNIAKKEISTLIGAKQSAAQLGTKTQLLDRIQQTLAQSQQDSD